MNLRGLKSYVKGAIIAVSLGGFLVYQKSTVVQGYIHSISQRVACRVWNDKKLLIYLILGVGILGASKIYRASKKSKKKYKRCSIAPSLRVRVFERDKFHCVYCGVKGGKGMELHVDHIIPVSKGGKNKLENLQTLCKKCNLGKAARIIKR